jgi:hypothetical protein
MPKVIMNFHTYSNNSKSLLFQINICHVDSNL